LGGVDFEKTILLAYLYQKQRTQPVPKKFHVRIFSHKF